MLFLVMFLRGLFHKDTNINWGLLSLITANLLLLSRDYFESFDHAIAMLSYSKCWILIRVCWMYYISNKADAPARVRVQVCSTSSERYNTHRQKVFINNYYPAALTTCGFSGWETGQSYPCLTSTLHWIPSAAGHYTVPLKQCCRFTNWLFWMEPMRLMEVLR